MEVGDVYVPDTFGLMWRPILAQTSLGEGFVDYLSVWFALIGPLFPFRRLLLDNISSCGESGQTQHQNLYCTLDTLHVQQLGTSSQPYLDNISSCEESGQTLC
jgi:hypothetical protein